MSTTKIKDQYEEALERLKEIGVEAGLEGLEPLLRCIDRFNGELRRKNAAARATAEQFEAQVREMQARLAERKGLAMEVEALAAMNRVLEKENGRLRDSLAGLEGQLAEEAQRVFKNADDMVPGASTFTKVRTLERAKCALRVKSGRQKNNYHWWWEWRLPDQDNEIIAHLRGKYDALDGNAAVAPLLVSPS